MMPLPDQSQLPRLLFLSSESPHLGAAGAIVFHRLLRDYPADRLLVVTNTAPPPTTARLAFRDEHLPPAAGRVTPTSPPPRAPAHPPPPLALEGKAARMRSLGAHRAQTG